MRSSYCMGSIAMHAFLLPTSPTPPTPPSSSTPCNCYLWHLYLRKTGWLIVRKPFSFILYFATAAVPFSPSPTLLFVNSNLPVSLSLSEL